LAWITNYNNKS